MHASMHEQDKNTITTLDGGIKFTSNSDIWKLKPAATAAAAAAATKTSTTLNFFFNNTFYP